MNLFQLLSPKAAIKIFIVISIVNFQNAFTIRSTIESKIKSKIITNKKSNVFKEKSLKSRKIKLKKRNARAEIKYKTFSPAVMNEEKG